MLTVISSFEELKGIESELADFYKTFDANYFLSPLYCIKAYELFTNDDSIYFIIKRDKSIIVGYIPLLIDVKGTLKFIFDKHTDFLSEVGFQFDFNDYKKITQEIKKNPTIKKIDLDNLHSESKLLHFFKHFFTKGCSVHSYNNHSFITTKEKGGLLKHLSSSNRSELKRICKKTSSSTFNVIMHPEQFPKKEIDVLRLKMIENGRRDLTFLNESTVSLIEYLYENGEAEIFSKSLNNQLVSASVALKNKVGKRMVWIDLYDDIQYINLSSYIEYIYYLNEKDVRYLNFGRGSYDYKAKNFLPNCENLYNLRYKL